MAGSEIKTVGVIGAGTIGASWSALFLAHGHAVRVFDPAPEAERHVKTYVEAAWPSLERLGATAQGKTGGDPTALSFHPSAAAAARGCDYIQESVPERLALKHATYREIEPALEPHCVVASSASGLLVQEMQAGWRDPGRFLLAHPFNPPHLIPLVELVAGERSEAAALETAEAFLAACGKVTIRLRKEVPAHVANRLQAALWREAIHLAAEGVASVEDIDKAVVHGPGLRWAVMGPHRLFSLAALGDGIEGFCRHFKPSFERWWADLGQPELTPEVIALLAQGLSQEEAGRTFDDLAAERDGKLVEVLRTLREIEGR